MRTCVSPDIYLGLALRNKRRNRTRASGVAPTHHQMPTSSADSPPSTAYSGFFQSPPQIPNPFTSDPLLHRILTRYLPSPLVSECSPAFDALAATSVSPRISEYTHDTNISLPTVVHWDGWGRRKDELRTCEGWNQLKGFWAQSGMMKDFYERPYSEYSRLVGFTKSLPHWESWFDSRYYLIGASLGGTTCPLAMTDGAARCLELHGPKDIQTLAIPKLIATEQDQLWTSGQWMTERPGGSDVSNTETRAYPSGTNDGSWIIKGFKWFSSATDSEMTLLLARTPGVEKLSLFWARTKFDDGTLNGVRIIRLKDKFGTKAIPTAELELVGMQGAVMIGKEGEGVKIISEVLNITRIHCAFGCIVGMRRAFSIVTVTLVLRESLIDNKDYASKRKVFGRFLKDTPLHVRTLASLAVQLRYLTHFTFYVTSLLGKVESLQATDDERLLLRLLTPILKGTVAKLAMPFLSECMEALGGQGYVEEGGIAVIYRDLQVNSIWEGTTNVLAHDMLRVLRGKQGEATLAALDRYVAAAVREVERCEKLGDWGTRYKGVYEKWRGKLTGSGERVVELHARELVIWLGRTVGALEMLRDAARDGDDVEVECCKRVFGMKNHGWEGEVDRTIEWDRRIVFGDGVMSSSPATIRARL